MDEHGKITLSKPVLINGVEVKEMTYDTDEISGALYAQAESAKMKASGSKGGNLAEGVIDRNKGRSLREFARIGRGFFIASGDSEADSSDEQSETTPEPTTQARQSSKESQ